MKTVDKKYFLYNKGINTEAPLVGWPVGFTIDEQNFDLLIDGSRRRRPGLVPEPEEPPVVPPEPPPDVVAEDCFNLFTKLVTTTRASADGFELDPELQFETEANTTYFLYGLLKFKQSNATGNPGYLANYYHAGDTVSFQHLGSQSASMVNELVLTGSLQFNPIPLGDLGSDNGFMSGSINLTTRIGYVFVDAMLVTGDTPGTFGIKWGLLNSGAGGTTDLLVDSYFAATKVVDV